MIKRKRCVKDDLRWRQETIRMKYRNVPCEKTQYREKLTTGLLYLQAWNNNCCFEKLEERFPPLFQALTGF